MLYAQLVVLSGEKEVYIDAKKIEETDMPTLLRAVKTLSKVFDCSLIFQYQSDKSVFEPKDDKEEHVEDINCDYSDLAGPEELTVDNSEYPSEETCNELCPVQSTDTSTQIEVTESEDTESTSIASKIIEQTPKKSKKKKAKSDSIASKIVDDNE